MTDSFSQLYDRLQAFSLDAIDVAFPFSQRLMQENAWSSAYTQRVIEEYKRFALLGVLAGHPVSPSDAIDQVWHLHLTYSRSYWDDFCPNVLGQPFHHEPSQGGVTEKQKFESWYVQTLASYERLFGTIPPDDIWLAPEKQAIAKSIRVNPETQWVLSKMTGESIRQSIQSIDWIFPMLGVAIALVLVLLFTPWNPFDLSGPDFLKFYGALGGIVFAIVWMWQRWLIWGLGIEIDASTISLYGIAALSDRGGMRLTGLVSLIEKGWIEVDSEQKTVVLQRSADAAEDPMEAAMLAALADNLDPKTSSPAEQEINLAIQNQLREKQLLIDESHHRSIQTPLLLGLLVLILGVIRMGLGLSHGRPIGYLAGMWVMFLVVGGGYLWMPTIGLQRTGAGDRLLEKLRKKFPQETAAQSGHLAYSVALFGSQALPEDWRSQLDWLLPIPVVMMGDSIGGGTDSYGGCGNSCSGGGCGGGCGGGWGG